MELADVNIAGVQERLIIPDSGNRVKKSLAGAMVLVSVKGVMERVKDKKLFKANKSSTLINNKAYNPG